MRVNGCVVRGTKAELVARAVDGHMHGRMLPCKLCRTGTGKLMLGVNRTVVCSGFFVDRLHVPCKFRGFADKVPRGGKWVSPEEADADAQVGAAADGRDEGEGEHTCT
jgi:hypothetical protein